MKKERNKLTEEDITKIQARYANKLDEFSYCTLEELKDKFNNEKMSSTDKNALIEAVNLKLHKNNGVKVVE